MSDISVIIWWFPLLFMVHEFEEIILMKDWKRKNAKGYARSKIKPYKDFVSTEAFTVAVLEEIILILGVCLHVWLTGWLLLYLARAFYSNDITPCASYTYVHGILWVCTRRVYIGSSLAYKYILDYGCSKNRTIRLVFTDCSFHRCLLPFHTESKSFA